MSFKSFLKGVFRRLFPIKDIKSALNIKVALSQEMLCKIEHWQKCYSGNAPWVSEKDDINSLRLEQSITREFANIVLNEMTANVTNSKLDKIYKSSVRNLNMNLQEGLATGAMVIKPLGEDKVQYVSANAFIPIEFDSRGRLLKVVFPEFKKIGDNYYTRLEYHDLDPINGLTITNKAYISSSVDALGREILLTDVEEWQNLMPNVRYPLMKHPAFGYYRNPIKNNIDGSHCGVSIFDSALDTIRKADVQFGRLDWEFESAERRIDVDITALKTENNRLKVKDKIFRGVDIEEHFKEFSPAIRDENFINGLNEYKREIEFQVGLAYGDISDPDMVSKTATEVITAKTRKYNSVTAVQENLKDCLEDLVYALAFYNSMVTSNYKFVCDFKDSILTDEETERKQDIQDLSLGIIRPEEYRAKWYGEDLETAKSNLPQTAEVEL